MTMICFDEIKSRVTIRDILADCGFQPRGNRIPCPIHGGQNPTSFSFTDNTYICFSCGASGGLIDLTEILLNKNRKDAIHYLAEKAGVPWQDIQGMTIERIPIRAIKLSPAPGEDAGFLELIIDLKGLELLRHAYTWQIQCARKSLLKGELSLSEFHSIAQYNEYLLEDLNTEIIRTNYEINMRKKVLSNERKISIK